MRRIISPVLGLDLMVVALVLISSCAYQTSESKTITYACWGETTFTVHFNESGDEVLLDDPQTHSQSRLHQEETASGARYSDGHRVFWSKGDSALVRDGDKVIYSGCQPQQ